MWILGGYVNTACYMVAPSCVDVHHKAAANGLLAITYQTAHCTGLVVATVIAATLFGGFSPISGMFGVLVSSGACCLVEST